MGDNNVGDGRASSLFEKGLVELADPIRNSVLAVVGRFREQIFGCLVLVFFRVIKFYILKGELIIKNADRFLIVF